MLHLRAAAWFSITVYGGGCVLIFYHCIVGAPRSVSCLLVPSLTPPSMLAHPNLLPRHTAHILHRSEQRHACRFLPTQARGRLWGQQRLLCGQYFKRFECVRFLNSRFFARREDAPLFCVHLFFVFSCFLLVPGQRGF